MKCFLTASAALEVLLNSLQDTKQTSLRSERPRYLKYVINSNEIILTSHKCSKSLQHTHHLDKQKFEDLLVISVESEANEWQMISSVCFRYGECLFGCVVLLNIIKIPCISITIEFRNNGWYSCINNYQHHHHNIKFAIKHSYMARGSKVHNATN